MRTCLGHVLTCLGCPGLTLMPLSPGSKRRCELCGSTSRRACGLLARTGVCGLPDPRLADVAPVPPEHKPMNQNRMTAARLALARLRPCGAHARTTGQPCKRTPCRGSTRCRLHGGRSTGAPTTNGKRTLARQREERFVHLMLRVVRATNTKQEPRFMKLVNGQWVDAD